MHRLRLILGLAVLAGDKSPIGLPGHGEDDGPGRCPKHRDTYLLEEHNDRFWCQKCGRYVDKKDRLLP